MRTNNLGWQKMTITLSVMVLSVVISGCKKDYTKDLHNDYVDGKPNPPSTVAVPVINSILPTAVLPNSVISIKGASFDPLPANNVVTINGVQATVNAVVVDTYYGVGGTELLVTVPANATTGPVVLKIGSNTVTSTNNLIVTGGTVSTFKDMGAISLKHISIDGSGNMFGDDGAKSIYEITVGGTVSLIAGGPNSTFKSIWGTVIDALGNVYTSDRGGFNIIKVKPDGTIFSFAGNGTEGIMDGAGNAARFSAPTGMAIDQSNNLYVNDTHRVRKISNVGLVTTLAGSAADGIMDGTGAAAQFGSLEGITVDADKNVYVSDTKYKTIRKITPAGVVTTLAGTGTPGFTDGPGNVAQFNNPHGLAVDAAGNVFVADEDYLLPVFKIRMINRLGVVTTLLTGTSNTGVINGPLATASTNFPDGMTIDVSGNLYIANTGANTISKVTIK